MGNYQTPPKHQQTNKEIVTPKRSLKGMDKKKQLMAKHRYTKKKETQIKGEKTQIKTQRKNNPNNKSIESYKCYESLELKILIHFKYNSQSNYTK